MDFRWFKDLLSIKTNDNLEAKQNAVEEVCVFPLPHVVLFPGTLLPLPIFEERYKIMADDILNQNLPVAMSLGRLQSNGELLPSMICGAGKANLVNSFPDGRKDIFVEGRKRLKIVRFLQKEPYIKALGEPVPDVPFQSEAEEKKCHEELCQLAKRWVFLIPELDDSYIKYVDCFTRPHYLADFIAASFLPSGDEKQVFLETVERKERIKKIMHFIEKQISLLEKKSFDALYRWNPEIKVLH